MAPCPISPPPTSQQRSESSSRDTTPPYYAGDDLHDAKVRKLHRVMAEHDLDAVVLFRDEAVRHLTDFLLTSSHG